MLVPLTGGGAENLTSKVSGGGTPAPRQLDLVFVTLISCTRQHGGFGDPTSHHFSWGIWYLDAGFLGTSQKTIRKHFYVTMSSQRSLTRILR